MKNASGTAGIHSSKMSRFVELYMSLKRDSTPQTPMKVVVFANLTSTLRLAIRALQEYNPLYDDAHVYVHAGISSGRVREDLYTKFRTQDDVEALFMTIKLGSVGLNLTEANTVIMLEPWYSYAALYQAEGRVHRIGQMKPVHVYYFIGRDTVEERIYNIAQRKKSLSQEVTNSCDESLKSTDFQFLFQ